MTMKYGTVEFFTLEELRDLLMRTKYEQLDLICFQKLKFEVEIKYQAAIQEFNKKVKP